MMSEVEEEPPDLLTLTQLRLVVNQAPQPYRVHVQVDGRHERQTSQGSTYFEVKLSDSADSLVWRVFDSNPALEAVRQLQRGSFVELAGQWLDTGRYGIEPKLARLRLLTAEERTAVLNGDPAAMAHQAADYSYICSEIEAVADPRLRQLGLTFLERHGERFKRTAAARENHHARRGGLVEHVAQMMRAAKALTAVYPHLNRDLIIASVLFHDCGKLWENAFGEDSFTMPYHLHGEMLGHITLGLEVVNKLWRELMEGPEAMQWAALEPPPELVRLHLLHLIASHHGQYEFGSPVLPKTPEAVLLHHVDNIDAKLEMFRRGYATSREIGPGIFERFRPWPVNVVAPLPVAFSASPAGAPGENEPPTHSGGESSEDKFAGEAGGACH